jgi:hypothetical protein
MQRTLIVVIVLYLIWRVLHAYGRRMARRAASAEDYSRFSARRRGRQVAADGDGQQPDEELVACRACGTCVPGHRVVVGGDGRPFCSDTCRLSDTPSSSHVEAQH